MTCRTQAHSRLRRFKKRVTLLLTNQSYNLDTAVVKIRFQLEAIWYTLPRNCYNRNYAKVHGSNQGSLGFRVTNYRGGYGSAFCSLELSLKEDNQ